MPVVECPDCGSCYHVSQRALGKRVRCQCGRVIAEPESPAGGGRSDERIEPAPPEVDKPGTDATAPTAPSPAEIVRRLREGIAARNLPMRDMVALACVGYGGLMALLLVAGVPALGSAVLIPLLDAVARPACAVLVAVSGVMILREHPHATVFAGISTVMLCFLPICNDVNSAFLLMAAVRPGPLLLLLLRAAVVYPIPVWIIYWAVRQQPPRFPTDRDDDWPPVPTNPKSKARNRKEVRNAKSE